MGANVNILVVEECFGIFTDGSLIIWKRQIESIDKTLHQKTVEKVAAPVTGPKLMLTKNEKDRTDKVVVVQYTCTRATVQNPGTKPIYIVPCRILVQRILDSTPQSLAKIKPGKKYLRNTFLVIRVRMVSVSPPAFSPDSPLVFSSLPAVQRSHIAIFLWRIRTRLRFLVQAGLLLLRHTESLLIDRIYSLASTVFKISAVG